jgi:predicted membrane protein
MNLTIITGAGNSELNLGTLDLTKLDIQTGAGVTSVDLNGTWQHNLDVSIEGGVGELTVNLPAEMGVRVDMDTALVNVTADGLIKVENGYVNESYGSAPQTLSLKLQAGVGSVVLVAPRYK